MAKDEKYTKAQKESIGKIQQAILVAREVFGPKLTGEMVFGTQYGMQQDEEDDEVYSFGVMPGGVYERVLGVDDEEGAHQSLLKARDLAKELFDTGAPDPVMIFGCHDYVFAE